MITAYALLAQYDGKVIIPIEDLCRDFFRHLTVKSFREKLKSGEITLPIVRLDDSRQAAMGVHVEDLASYIDQRTRKARSKVE